MQLSSFSKLLKHEATPGIILMLCALLALILKNSPLAHYYDSLLLTTLAIKIGELEIYKPLLMWVNDGLMAIFFLLVGLEIKREILEGGLSTKEQMSLPSVAALGGILVPAAIYILFNHHDPVSLQGWAIPAATDIAFALGVLALLGKRVPLGLKVALLAIAIIDDLAAIVIIAFFYSGTLSMLSMGLSLIAILVLAVMNFVGVKRLASYIVVGLFLWTCVLKSGVHATLAGVILALFIPLKGKHIQRAPLKHLEVELHLWVYYLILPIFAFVNAGVSLKGLSLSMFLSPITLGIILGLFIGKPVGVMLLTWLGTLLNVVHLPKGVTWKAYFGMACLTGIGFTMSLFIGTLAFNVVEHHNAVRLGVLAGSLLSGILGFIILKLTLPDVVKNIDNEAEQKYEKIGP